MGEEDDEEKKRITEERLAAYHAKKAKKPKVIAKTNVLFDVKPWDDETDMEAMKKACVSIEMDGLLCEPPSWSLLAMASTSYSSCVSLRTTKYPSRSLARRCLSSRILSSQLMLQP